MKPILILAQTRHEATRIARRYELSPREWVYVGDEWAFRGRIGCQVIATECWYGRRYVQEVTDINRALQWAEAKVAWVGCE